MLPKPMNPTQKICENPVFKGLHMLQSHMGSHENCLLIKTCLKQILWSFHDRNSDFFGPKIGSRVCPTATKATRFGPKLTAVAVSPAILGSEASN